MLSNYFTLAHIARLLDTQLKDFGFADAWTHVSNECVIRFFGNGEEPALVVSCEPARNFAVLTGSQARPKRNTLSLFEAALGSFVDSVKMHPSDREIRIELSPAKGSTSKRLALVLQMFGPKANVFLVDEHDTIMDSFLKRRSLTGTKLVSRPAEETIPEWNVNDAAGLFQQSPNEFVRSALKKLYPSLDPLLVDEILSLARIEPASPVSSVQGETLRRLIAESESLMQQLLRNCAPVIYYSDSGPDSFSIIPLQTKKNLKERMFESLFAAIRSYVRNSASAKQAETAQEGIADRLRGLIAKVERTIEKMESETESAARAREFELKGKLLTLHLQEIKKGARSVTLRNDFNESGETISIELEPSISPHVNAEKYFARARKAMQAAEEKKERRAVLLRKLEIAERLLQSLEELPPGVESTNVSAQQREALEELGIKLSTRGGVKPAEQVPFRVFTVEGGFQVWAGKSSENNDLLTLKYAKPNDYWFHARGSAGSHVVLRAGTGKGEPSKKAIEQAAAIAAYYSKMRNAKNIPVAMCLKKYVRKPKGAPAGTVQIEREKLLFVDPALPGEPS